MYMTRATKRRVDRLLGKRDPLVSTFVPSGRSGYYLYAVVLRDHPDKVKIGMTSKWKQRRQSYATWNLASGDGILDERVFAITEEFIDLKKLENHVVKTFNAPIAFGSEWFFATLDEASRHIDVVLSEHGISYDI